MAASMMDLMLSFTVTCLEAVSVPLSQLPLLCLNIIP